METEILVDFEMDEDQCPCQGGGWCPQLTEWAECPVHYHGQLHPDTRALLLDEPNRLQEEERRSHLRWRIEQVKDQITSLTQSLRQANYELTQLELELVNKTPTVRAMSAIQMPRE